MMRPEEDHHRAVRKPLLEQPPEVVQRWVRLKIRSFVPRVGRRLARPRVWYTERKRRRALEGAFDAIKKNAIALERSPYEANRVFTNIALYILLAERDISAAKLDALAHPDPWKRNLALRTILLTIHEWDVDKLSGQKLQRAMDDASIEPELRGQVVDALRRIRKVQARSRRVLSHVRNSAIAHRDPDALIQYRAIRDLDSDAILGLAVEFYDSAGAFISLLPRLILAGGSLDSLLRQLRKSNA